MALNRYGFRERQLSGSLNTTLNDRRWPSTASRKSTIHPFNNPAILLKPYRGRDRLSTGLPNAQSTVLCG
jgi:hypothetical protein